MLIDSVKRLLVLGCVFVALGFSGNTQAQIQLSLEGAKQHALEHNKSLINAGLAIDEAGARLREAIGQGLPQVEASLDYSNFFGSTATFGEPPMAMTIEFSPTSNFNAQVGQLIFSGSYIVGIQMAKLYQEMSKTSFERSELEIKAQVTQAYVLCLVAEESKVMVERNLENMKDLLVKTRSLVDVGVAEEVDYDQLVVQVGMIGNAIRAADRQVELAYNMLRLQMGLRAESDIVLTDGLDDLVGAADFKGRAISPFSLEQSPDFKLMEFQTKLAEKQVNMERAAYLPTIAGFYNYTEKVLKSDFDLNPNHIIGLNMSIPIFAGGTKQARVTQARINLDIARNQMELIQDQLMIQEKQLRYNLTNAIENYESQQANVAVAKRVYDSINNKYQQGMASSLDLTTANSNYLQSENSYISALMQLMDAYVAMEKLLNEL